MLATINDRGDVHGLVQGRATRLLHDLGAWPHDRVERRLSRALSSGTAPPVGAAFVEGFLAGSGTLLVHDAGLLDVIDRWLSGLAHESFISTAPLLRRTFGAFDASERRQLGELVAHQPFSVGLGFGAELHDGRVADVMRTVRLLLGAPV